MFFSLLSKHYTCESMSDPVSPSSSLVITQLAFAMIATEVDVSPGCLLYSCQDNSYSPPAEHHPAAQFEIILTGCRCHILKHANAKEKNAAFLLSVRLIDSAALDPYILSRSS